MIPIVSSATFWPVIPDIQNPSESTTHNTYPQRLPPVDPSHVHEKKSISSALITAGPVLCLPCKQLNSAHITHTTENQPSRHFEELLREKMAGEEDRPLAVPAPAPPDHPEYDHGPIENMVSDNVFDPALMGIGYNNTEQLAYRKPLHHNDIGDVSAQGSSSCQSTGYPYLAYLAYQPESDAFAPIISERMNTAPARNSAPGLSPTDQVSSDYRAAVVRRISGMFETSGAGVDRSSTSEYAQNAPLVTSHLSGDYPYWTAAHDNLAQQSMPYNQMVQANVASQHDMSRIPVELEKSLPPVPQFWQEQYRSAHNAWPIGSKQNLNNATPTSPFIARPRTNSDNWNNRVTQLSPRQVPYQWDDSPLPAQASRQHPFHFDDSPVLPKFSHQQTYQWDDSPILVQGPRRQSSAWDDLRAISRTPRQQSFSWDDSPANSQIRRQQSLQRSDGSAVSQPSIQQSNPWENAPAPAPSQPQGPHPYQCDDSPVLSQVSTNPMTPTSHQLATPDLHARIPFASSHKIERLSAPHVPMQKDVPREARSHLRTSLSPTASTSSRYSLDMTASSSMRPGSASMLASMTGAMRLSAGNNYASVGNEANGGSGSIYDHFEASGMGNGDNHGDHDHVNGNFSGDGFDNHEVGRDGDGEGDGDGDEEERQRQKKLSLACHFCRRRKLKCDGTRPTCDNCAKRSEPCTYDEVVRRRGPGKRTKEMRERAAREAEAEGMTNANSAGAGPGPTTLAELESKKGKKRKSEGVDDGDKRPKFEEDEDDRPPGFG